MENRKYIEMTFNLKSEDIADKYTSMLSEFIWVDENGVKNKKSAGYFDGSYEKAITLKVKANSEVEINIWRDGYIARPDIKYIEPKQFNLKFKADTVVDQSWNISSLIDENCGFIYKIEKAV